ncbi:hypothetical protein VNO78_10865 [Psophocarpus tetragonolobus]|uniref:Kinetochore protein Nuf2 N-terminal domain-containing protein n=1 Tax=Psophocarpus tetragonolobus TaxID=3891 RepID=A0AAN9SM21_PSOTE
MEYEYPELRRHEVIKILAQFQMANVTEQEICKATSSFISDLYSRVLIHLGILLEEDAEQLDFNALEQLENPDLHIDSVRTIQLYNNISEVLAALECPRKFTLADLIMPDPDGTFTFLGALLNFCLYRDTKMKSVSEIVEQVEALEMQRIELEETTILQLKMEISEFNEAKERDMPLVEEVEVKVKELKQTIATLNNQQSLLRSTLRKLKEKSGEMDEKITNAEFALVDNVKENANLRSKIGQSPDKVQRALEENKLAREEARNAERLAMQAFHEKTALVEVFSKAYKKMSKHYKLMQTIQEQVNSAKSIEKDLKVLKAKLSDEEISEKSLEVKLVERQSKVEQMEELRRQLEKEHNIMCQEATKYLNSTKLEVESKRSATETRQRNVEAVLSEVDTINSKITSEIESRAVKVEMLARKCEELVEAFHNYANPIAAVIESEQKRLKLPKGGGIDISE